jgi:ABC-type dipeptide/oligopeptide/nickel transport system ATPase component
MDNNHNHPLNGWKQFLSEYGYNSLIKYVENVKNNRENKTILLLTGEGPTGKSTLKRQIVEYIGKGKCTQQDITNINFHTKFISLVEFGDTLLINDNKARKQIQGVINFGLFKLSGVYIHPDLHDFPTLFTLLQSFTIIEMTHSFR